jgi:hypothetical protein
MDAKEYLEISLGGNMNISTLTPSAWHDIMTGFAKHYHKELAESDLGAVSGSDVFRAVDDAMTFIDYMHQITEIPDGMTEDYANKFANTMHLLAKVRHNYR